MTLFDDAAAFMKNRTPQVSEESGREMLIQKLRRLFENATRQEVEHALNRLSERETIPEDFNEVVKKVRIWLED